jgi:hypothetical protein
MQEYKGLKGLKDCPVGEEDASLFFVLFLVIFLIDRAEIITISGKSEEALKQYAVNLYNYIDKNTHSAPLSHIAVFFFFYNLLYFNHLVHISLP